MNTEHMMITRLTTGFVTPEFSKFARGQSFKWVKYMAMHQLASQVLKDFVARSSDSTMWMIALEKGMTPKCLEHQIVILWYLPGIGSTAFKLNNYLSKSLASMTMHEKLRRDCKKIKRNYDKVAQARTTYKFLIELPTAVQSLAFMTMHEKLRRDCKKIKRNYDKVAQARTTYEFLKELPTAVKFVQDDQVTEGEKCYMLEDRCTTKHNETCIEGEELLREIQVKIPKWHRGPISTEIDREPILAQGPKAYMQWVKAENDRKSKEKLKNNLKILN